MPYIAIRAKVKTYTRVRSKSQDLYRNLLQKSRLISEFRGKVKTYIGFFGKNQDKNPIVIKVHEDIVQHQKRLGSLEEKKLLVKSLING